MWKFLNGAWTSDLKEKSRKTHLFSERIRPHVKMSEGDTRTRRVSGCRCDEKKNEEQTHMTKTQLVDRSAWVWWGFVVWEKFLSYVNDHWATSELTVSSSVGWRLRPLVTPLNVGHSRLWWVLCWASYYSPNFLTLPFAVAAFDVTDFKEEKNISAHNIDNWVFADLLLYCLHVHRVTVRDLNRVI